MSCRISHVKFLLTIFLVCFSLIACGTFDNHDLDRATLLQQTADKYAVPGAVYAELSGNPGSSPRSYATGLADIPAGTAMNEDMSFRVGSITKTFTATAILILVDRGLLSLDTAVEAILPGKLPNGDRITVRQLLMMRSGLSDYHTSQGFLTVVESDPLHIWTFDELAALVEIEDEPDEYFAYRNINYVTLGTILEEISGRSRAEFIADEICSPLGLSRTYVPTTATMPSNSACGYLPSEDSPQDLSEYFHPSWAGGAGDMISTASDIVTWLKALRQGTLLSSARNQDMFAMRGAFLHGGYAGYGQGVLNLYGAIGHGGDYSGIYTSAMFEYQGHYMAVLVNGCQKEDGGDATDIFYEMARRLYPPADNPTWREDQLNTTLAMARDCLDVPGIVAKISLADQTTWTGVTGLASADDSTIAHTWDWTGEAMRDDLKFRIASVSKTVTATAILQLWDAGLLSLEDRLAEWLPLVDISTSGDVTIRQLLNHTSGIPDFIRNKEFFDLNYDDPLRDWTLEERIAYGVPLAEPGSVWAYSNTGYILLGMIIEAASGRNYADYLQENIFDPLGMADTSVPGLYDYTMPEPYAKGYTFSFNPMGAIPDTMPADGWLKNQSISNWQGLGYGNIIATPADLLIWLQALTDGRLLTEDSCRLMHDYVETDTQGLRYGLGVEDHNGYAGHDGDLPGYHIGAYSKAGNSLVVLMNGDSFFGRGYEVVRSLGGVLGL